MARAERSGSKTVGSGYGAPHAAKIVAGYTGAHAAGSYVVVSCGSGDEATGGRLAAEYQPVRLRNHAPEQIAGFLDGLTLIEPGVVDLGVAARGGVRAAVAARRSRPGGRRLQVTPGRSPLSRSRQGAAR